MQRLVRFNLGKNIFLALVILWVFFLGVFHFVFAVVFVFLH